MATPTVLIDGEEVNAIEGGVSPRLNRPSAATCKVPRMDAVGDLEADPMKLKVLVDDELEFHGRVMQDQTDMGDDTGYVVYNALSPMEIWQWRPARDPDGDMSMPTFINDIGTAPQIMESILEASENPALIPSLAEGPLGHQIGTFAGGGALVNGAPTDWPMTIAEVASLLVSTGQLDLVETFLDDGTNMSRVDGYNGDYGNDLSGSIAFEYGMGAYNAQACRWIKDRSNEMNKLWTYLGPRVETAGDPGGDQHWRANITGTDSGLSDPPRSAVLARRALSQTRVGVRMEVQIHDALGEDEGSFFGVYRELYRWLWLAESWARAVPRSLYYVELARDQEIGTFGIGDLVTVRCTDQVRGGFSGVQRIYEYTMKWDQDSVMSISDVQTSPDNEGFT
jgi:hypothetical protein